MALKYIHEWQHADVKYNGIHFEIVDELVEVERADAHDYWYVPTFYLDGNKLHEGGIYKDEVKQLMDKVLG
jgi:hypothetical protein